MKSGIYKITNKVNGKFYIGKSVDCKSRKYAHIYVLRRGKHGNTHLQRSWNKYSEENFEFSIIEYVQEDYLNIKEIYYIELLQPHYNIMKSEDTKLRMAQSSKNKLSFFQISKHKSKPVYSKSLLTGIITQHICRNNAATVLNIDSGSISKVLKGKRNSVNNYTFSYTQEFPTDKLSDKLSRTVRVYNIENQLINTYPSQKQCSEDLNMSYGLLHRLIKTGKSYKKTYYFSH